MTREEQSKAGLCPAWRRCELLIIKKKLKKFQLKKSITFIRAGGLTISKLRVITGLFSLLAFVGLFRHYFTLLHYSCTFQPEMAFWLCAEISALQADPRSLTREVSAQPRGSSGDRAPQDEVSEMPWCQVTVEETRSYPGNLCQVKERD